MTNERQPGYYWVKLENGKFVTVQYDLNGLWEYRGYYKPESWFTEIGSRITPEMRFTEEDMKECWNASGEYMEQHEAIMASRFNFDEQRKPSFTDWLKQKDKQREEEKNENK